MKKNNAWNIKRFVGDSFVQMNQPSSVLYYRLTNFNKDIRHLQPLPKWLTVISENFIPLCIHDLDNIFLNWFFCHAHDINCPHKTLTFSILGRSRKSISIRHTYFRCNTFLMLHTPTVQAYACHNLLYILFRVSSVIEFILCRGQNIRTQKVNNCSL